jgi:hypothetical protein
MTMLFNDLLFDKLLYIYMVLFFFYETIWCIFFFELLYIMVHIGCNNKWRQQNKIRLENVRKRDIFIAMIVFNIYLHIPQSIQLFGQLQLISTRKKDTESTKLDIQKHTCRKIQHDNFFGIRVLLIYVYSSFFGT